jgi:hypothetical protein
VNVFRLDLTLDALALKGGPLVEKKKEAIIFALAAPSAGDFPNPWAEPFLAEFMEAT